MSILSDFEDRVAGAVEGLFAGAFRSPVQPVELAKALARAMDDGRAVGVGKVYAPVSYTVALSREDKRNLGEFTSTLEGELSTYLSGHAEESGYMLVAKPTVRFDVHNDLKLGRFRVAADLAPTAPPAGDADAAAKVGAGAGTPAPAAGAAPAAPTPPVVPTAPAPRPSAPDVPPGVATLTVDEHDIVLNGPRMIIGRLTGCDICVPDRNISRQHAALVTISGGWGVTDLGSTNGTFVNGERVTSRPLADGDAIEVGATRLVYHAPRS
jgi:hypothetical protein